MIRNLIREFLLQEEAFGAQAFVYHGSETEPDILLPALLYNKFNPGEGSGSLYGMGLYTVYDLDKSATAKGRYGQYLYKLKVNLYGFISFDPDVTRLIYKKDLEPWQQAKEVGANPKIVKKLKETYRAPLPGKLSSNGAVEASKFLKGQVKGIIYTGENDGRCALAYDASVAVPVAWKEIDDSSWTPVDREWIKPALRQSSTGDWEKEKYEFDPLKFVAKLAKLPIEQRISEKSLIFDYHLKPPNLPAGLKVKGSLRLGHSEISSLPQGLEVTGNLILSYTNVTKLPDDIKVGGSLILTKSKITSLPAGLKVGKTLDLNETAITELPDGLEVGGSLTLYDCKITSLPDNIKVGGHLDVSSTPIKSLPDGLKVGENLNLDFTKIKSLPAGLEVGRRLTIRGAPIDSLPNDLQVGGEIWGFKGDMNNVPKRLRSKLFK